MQSRKPACSGNPLSRSPECWEHRQATTPLALMWFWGPEFKSSHLYSKHFNQWVASLVPHFGFWDSLGFTDKARPTGQGALSSLAVESWVYCCAFYFYSGSAYLRLVLMHAHQLLHGLSYLPAPSTGLGKGISNSIYSSDQSLHYKWKKRGWKPLQYSQVSTFEWALKHPRDHCIAYSL